MVIDHLGPILACGIPALLGTVFFLWAKHTLDGRAAPIVVVDRRTMRLAQQHITTALHDEDLTRAYAGLTALTFWLRYQIRTGPSRTRIKDAAALEQAELQKDQIAARMSLTGYRF